MLTKCYAINFIIHVLLVQSFGFRLMLCIDWPVLEYLMICRTMNLNCDLE